MMHLLWKQLEKCGLRRLDCDVVAAVAEDVPGEPKRRHITAGREQLHRALRDHKTVILLGNVPLEAITDKRGIKQKRGRPWEQEGKIFLPMMTPGVMAYDEKAVPMFEADCRLFTDIARKGKIPREERLDWTIVDSRQKFEDMLRDLRGTVSFDIETTGLNPWAKDAHVVSIGFGTATQQWCLPLGHPEFQSFGLDDTQMVARIDRRLRECFIVAHNGKFDSVYMRVHYGVRWRIDFDTMLAHWMLDENQRHGLKLLAQIYFGAPNYDADLDEKRGVGPVYQHCLYLAHDVYYTRQLRFKFARLFDEDGLVERAFDLITMPVSRLFADIEYHGVLVDYDRFEEVEKHLRAKMAATQKMLHEELLKCGLTYDEAVELNWRSPQQVAALFFDRLKIKPIGKKDKKGKVKERSTAESVLKQIEHPVAVALMEFRATDQNLKMFIDGWRPYLVKHEDGWRLHPVFKLHGTVTGRASCEHPNLQQVPRDPVIRSLIIAPEGWDLVEVDLSQIEMRLAGEVSGDPELLRIFIADEDVHWNTAIKEITRGAGMGAEILATALEIVKRKSGEKWVNDLLDKAKLDPQRLIKGRERMDYGLAALVVHRAGPDLCAEVDPVWKELRKKAKAINFGYLYGMWWKKMIEYARDNYGVKLTERQAQESRKSYFATYKQLGPWHERQKRYARMHGYVRSLSGAKRRLPDAMSPDDTPKRAEALRQAINSPIQRFACELNFLALLQICDEFGWDVCRPIGTVHDATLIETRRDVTAKVYTRMMQIMEKPGALEKMNVKLKVPIRGDGKIGPWSKGVSLEKWIKNLQLEATARKAKVKA